MGPSAVSNIKKDWPFLCSKNNFWSPPKDGHGMVEDSLIPVEIIERKILNIRSTKVLLDQDLALLYGVETKYLTRQVRRNIERFPKDFCFVLTRKEFTDLKRQFGTSSGWGGRRVPPIAFTEQGVAMLSGVLGSEKAIQVNILIMRTFVQLRGLITSNQELTKKLDELEERYDSHFRTVFEAIRALMKHKEEPRRLIGFRDGHPKKK